MKPELRKNRPNLIDQKIRQFGSLALNNTIPRELPADKELSDRITPFLKGKADNLTWGTNEDHEKALHYSDTIMLATPTTQLINYPGDRSSTKLINPVANILAITKYFAHIAQNI